MPMSNRCWCKKIRRMNRYQFVKQLGDGTYGSVMLATTVENQEKVAIKKFYSFNLD